MDLNNKIQQIVKPNSLNINGYSINIIRTGRKKTMAVTVRDGGVSVFVPKLTNLSQIEAVIARKSKWIQQKLLQLEKQHSPIKHRFIEGERFLYCGVERTLTLVSAKRKSIQLDKTSLIMASNKQPSSVNIKNRLEKWYRSQAQLYLAQRTRHFSAIIGVKTRLVNTRTYSARWGCCSSRREITYNWQIIMAPENIIDYVIVHELCHIREHNHSPAFWTLIENVFADYRISKKWLELNGSQIQF